jgi:hypothetical protein
MRFAPEPIPSTVEPELAQYLDRQFNNIANASDAVFVAPVLQALPQREIPGGIVYIKDDGLYACVSEVANGDAEWKKLVTQ